MLASGSIQVMARPHCEMFLVGNVCYVCADGVGRWCGNGVGRGQLAACAHTP